MSTIEIHRETSAPTGRAIVIGASIAGLCAARVLAPRFTEVVIVERDELPDAPANRRGVPQGRHVHALLLAGQRRLQDWFPGLADELLSHGALRWEQHHQIHWHQAGGRQIDAIDIGHRSALCSRPMLEHHVRARVLALPNVTLRRDAVRGPVVAGGGHAIAGVELEGGTRIAADLVVDASGRVAVSERWLTELGYEPPARSEVRMDMGYATRILRRNPADGRDRLVSLILDDPPLARMGVIGALEGDRWMVTLAGFHGDRPPTDDAAWLAFARSLPDPAVADLIEECEPLGDIVTHRMVASQRRHVERMRRVPGGLVLLGDAVASFNPIYGQGMSSATLQAEALANALDRSRTYGPRFVRRYHRLAGRAVENPWRMSVGADFALPQTTGPKPSGTDVIGRYMRRVMRANHHDPVVVTRFREVSNLLRPPTALLTPAMMLRVFRASRRDATPAAPAAVATPASVLEGVR